MKQKLFTLLTLLVLCVTGAWATETSVIFSSDNKNDAGDAFGTFAKNSSITAGNGLLKIFSENNTNWAFSDKNKKGYRLDRNTFVFYFSGETDLTILYSRNNTTNSYLVLKPFNSDKAIADLAKSDITDLGSAIAYTSVEPIPSEGAWADVPTSVTVADDMLSWTGVKGGLEVTWEGLSAGYYQMSISTSNESYMYGFTADVTGGAETLSSPEISATADGKVTIGSVTNATKVTYTTDGTAPTAESTEYTSTFKVDDGTTVKAIAIGDGENYNNSDVATKVIYYAGIKVATPVIKTYNGSVGITSTTPGATIQYSTDGGSSWTTYARTFTLTADATLKAKATRTDCTDSDEASAEVEVVDNGWNHTVYLPYSLFDVGQRAGTSENNLLTGKTGTVAEGYSIAITGRDDKAIISGSNITIGGTAMQSMRVSNGAQNTLTIPDGVEVKGITFFSYNNYDSPDAGWKEVAGTSYEDDTKDSYWGNIPLQANVNVEDRLTNPDVRTYALNQTGGTVTYTNANNQPCYVIGVHVVVPEYTVTYYGNGNDEGTAPSDDDSYASGSTVTVLGAGTLAKSGNIFAGWNTAADGSGTDYAAGATFTITDDTDLYAQWTEVAGSGIIKVQITGGSTSTVTGTIGGSAEVSVQAGNPINDGYKFGSNGHYVGITLAGGNTFTTGDVINVHLTNAPDQGKIKIYDTKTGTNVLFDTDVAGVVGNNFFALPEEINGLNTIYICRVANTNTWNGYVDFIEVTRPNSTITLNASGFATYSNASDYTVTGATIYKMALDTETSTLAGTTVAAGTKIAAGEGILLKGDVGATVSIVETTGAEALEGNDLKGTTLANGSLASKGTANYYVLSGNEFKKYTGAAFAENKAYLESATELSSKLSLIFDDDETTSINNIEEQGARSKEQERTYNLAGQKVSESYKGIVIVNGRKFVRK